MSFQEGYELLKKADAIAGPGPRAAARLRYVLRILQQLPPDTQAFAKYAAEADAIQRGRAMRDEGHRLITAARAALVRVE
jgi:hypothetical protein